MSADLFLPDPPSGVWTAEAGAEYSEDSRPGFVLGGGYQRGRFGWTGEFGLSVETVGESTSGVLVHTRTRGKNRSVTQALSRASDPDTPSQTLSRAFPGRHI
jgi:hypothetical protein